MEFVEINVKENIELVEFISKSLSFSYSKALEYLNNGDIKINGDRVKKNTVLKSDDNVGIYLSDNEYKKLWPVIIYQDENVIIIDKPSGIESAGLYSEEQRLSFLLKKFVYACHRLDRNTKGLNVFALNDEALKEIEDCFKNKKVKKQYNALVFGKPLKEATLKDYIFKDAQKSLCYVYSDKRKGTQYIETKYKLIEQRGPVALLDIELVTGRTHQIRAHLKKYNLYIAGDGKYGDYNLNKKYGYKEQELYCTQLQFFFEANLQLKYLNGVVFKRVAKIR